MEEGKQFKILYVAPRYHTNQTAIMKGWIERGNKVMFLSYYAAIIEDYQDLEPIVLGFSLLYRMIDWLYVHVIKRKDLTAITLKINYGFPPLFKLKKIIKQFKPDIVIMRDRTLYSAAVYLLCKKKCCTILYSQSPLLDLKKEQGIKQRLARKLTPIYRITPVMGIEGEGKSAGENTFFIPFVVHPQIEPEKKAYFKNDRINILCIGKFEPRKHHMMLIEVLEALDQRIGNYHLTIIGEATNHHQKLFLQKVEQFRDERQLNSKVEIKTNIPKNQMHKYFEDTDVFIIPSTKEMASISQLEAMSYSIPVICSDQNGSSCYVKDGVNGYLFHDCNKEDLKSKVSNLLGNREEIREMGKNAYQSIIEECTFDQYQEGIRHICELNQNDKK